MVLLTLVQFSDVWGFDEDAVKALKTMEPPDSEVQLIKRYAILLNRESELLRQAKLGMQVRK